MYCRNCGEETLTSDFCQESCAAEFYGFTIEEDEYA